MKLRLTSTIYQLVNKPSERTVNLGDLFDVYPRPRGQSISVVCVCVIMILKVSIFKGILRKTQTGI